MFVQVQLEERLGQLFNSNPYELVVFRLKQENARLQQECEKLRKENEQLLRRSEHSKPDTELS